MVRPAASSGSTTLSATRLFAIWIGVTTALHLAWEVLQLPLYTLLAQGTPGEIAWSVLHCTVGDAMISASVFLVVAILLNALHWPLSFPRFGGLLFVVAGVGYTAFSEWRNVYQFGSWSYAGTMPTLAGIGLAPLAQWTIVPLIALWWLRQRAAADRAGSG